MPHRRRERHKCKLTIGIEIDALLQNRWSTSNALLVVSRINLESVEAHAGPALRRTIRRFEAVGPTAVLRSQTCI